MKKGTKVKVEIKVSEFGTEEKDGVISDVISSKWGKDMFAVKVGDEVYFRFEKELKKKFKMKPINFKGQNVEFGKDQPEYQTLPAFKASTGEVVTCWELSNEDFERLVETRRIYVCVNTFNNPLQPMFLSSDVNELLTFKNEENDKTGSEG